MKLSALINFLLVFCLHTSNAQINYDIGTKWVFSEIITSSGGLVTDYPKNIEIIDTKIVNGNAYYKIEAEGPDLCSLFASYDYVRYENDKMYFLYDESIELKVFDFSGLDSYQSYYINDDLQIDSVTFNIDSIYYTDLVDGQKLKTFDFSFPYLNEENEIIEIEITAYEGIGGFFFFPDFWFIGCEDLNNYNFIFFRCYSDANNDVGIYEDCQYMHISSLVDTKELKKSESEIILFPNPFDEVIHLKSQYSNYSNIEIYDKLGKRIYESQNQNQINLSQFPNGVYYLKVYDKSKLIWVEKIVKH